MANWEDALLEPEEPKEQTPIYTALYLEYREAAFRRMAAAAKEQFGKDARREDAIARAQQENQEQETAGQE